MPRRFPSHLLLALMLLAPAAGPLRAQENILRFYHRADSISEHPSRISDYEIRKSKRVGQNTVTFIGPSLPAKRNLPSGVAASEMSPSTFPAFIRNGDPMGESVPVLGSMAKAPIVRLAVLVT